MKTINHTHPNQAIAVVDHIRKAIISGSLKSGQPIRQDVLAEQFKVSKIPIREALNQLKAEGLVVFQNNRGAMVSSLSHSEVEEIYIMRLALEEIALKRAIPNMSPQDHIAAETALKLIDVSTESIQWSELNWEFHLSLYRPAQMPKLLETVSVLHNNVARYLLLYLKDMDFQTISQAEHWDLLNAAVSGNTKKAVNILRTHLTDALTQTLKYIDDRS